MYHIQGSEFLWICNLEIILVGVLAHRPYITQCAVNIQSVKTTKILQGCTVTTHTYRINEASTYHSLEQESDQLRINTDESSGRLSTLVKIHQTIL